MCTIVCPLSKVYTMLHIFYSEHVFCLWLMQCNMHVVSPLSANHLGASGYHSHAARAGWSRHGAAGLCSSSSEG